MSDIVAVLVVPAEGDPGGLLAPGRCGIIPAIAELRRYHQGPDEWALTSNRWMPIAALPLWWDGALVPEGWDRARRVYDHDGAAKILSHPATLYYDRSSPEHAVGAYALADGLRWRSLASRVVRLARVDGRLVEVTP